MNQDNMYWQQEEQLNGENVRSRIPQAQDDPALVLNQHYLPKGDLTITANISFVDSSVNAIVIPLVQIPTLFHQTFDSTEFNFSDSQDIHFPLRIFSPAPYIRIPNIARYLGYVILGIEMDTKYKESIMICCQNYLDGSMEILPNGSFRYLKQRRDGLARRYTSLCKAAYFSISANYYKTRPSNIQMTKEIQSLMQDLYDNSTYTSVYTKLIPFTVNDQEYHISKSTLRRWATTIPWHALIYNSQSPLSFDGFTDLFFKIFCVNQGKILRYSSIHSNVQHVGTIIPNSHLFINLTPLNMISSEVHIPPEITQQFVTFIRYLLLSEGDSLTWGLDEQENDDNDDSEQHNEQSTQDAESIDESELAY